RHVTGVQTCALPILELREPVEAAVAARWQRAARAAVVSLRPGIGYDFAMPTKMFAALACGTPVIFAGTRPAGELIEAEHLGWACEDRKSTRLNSSHVSISYAVFCLKKKINIIV